jgi:hypothetical protein
MATQFQNLKNFIRHGKQARQAQSPTTNRTHAFSEPAPLHGGITDVQQQANKQDFSANAGGNRNVAAQAAGVAANAAGAHQNAEDISLSGGATNKAGKAYDQEALAKIIAEEKANREKLPRYPGLDRWILQAKMGDGAFSNVYKARDSQGVYGEIAIKVVRKFELNASQVCRWISFTIVVFVHVWLDFALF